MFFNGENYEQLENQPDDNDNHKTRNYIKWNGHTNFTIAKKQYKNIIGDHP